MAGSAQVQQIAVEQKLRQMNDEWIKALVRRDGETLKRIMAEDFLFAYPLEGADRDEFVGDVVSGELVVEHLNRENVQVRVWGNAAVLTGHDSAKWFYKGREFSGHYKIVHVYAYRDDEWRLVALQACPIS